MIMAAAIAKLARPVDKQYFRLGVIYMSLDDGKGRRITLVDRKRERTIIAGLGVTEFFLRLMAWLCLRNDHYRNSQMCIVTGPNIDIAIKLIKRMKALFEPKLRVTFDSKETVLELNGCSVEAYPSNHIDAYRALDNPKFILIDEGDFFRKGEQEDARHVSERYIAKSDPYIVMVSTPIAPDGLFERIEKEAEETCIYKRIFLDYTYGIGKIYTAEEIEKAKQSPSFEREYNLKYLL